MTLIQLRYQNKAEPSAECCRICINLLNFYSLISDPTGILEKSSETFGPAGNGYFYIKKICLEQQ